VNVAIMQPTYLPWIGYLAMIDRVDRFIYLDSVQFARRSWQQRNRIRSGDGELMLTVPVFSKGLRGQTIAQTQVDWASGFARKHLKSIETVYRRTPYFEQYFEPLRVKYTQEAATLADFTTGLIEFLCGAFGIQTPCERSSGLPGAGKQAELLASICKSVGASQYLSAPRSRDYIEQSHAFERAGVTVRYHEYEHPIYPQGAGPFLSHMAAIDLLFCCGGQDGLEILRRGVRRV
jgi:hypothetical protein